MMNSSIKWIFLFGLIFCGIARPASNISFNGYVKNFSMVFGKPDFPQQPLIPLPENDYLGAMNQRARGMLSYQPSDWMQFNAEYDLSFRIQDSYLFSNDLFLAGINARDYRAEDFDVRLYPDEDNYHGSFGIRHNLDRLFLTVRAPFADIYIGRQAIAWGTARVINPTDVVAPFTFDELDKEERFGVDAVRVRVPIGFMGEFDSGYIFGRDQKFENSAFFLRAKYYIWQADVSALIIGFRKNLLLGFDLARAVGGASVWFEGAYVLADELAENPADDVEDYLRISIGADYNFGEKTYGFIEYHFNEAGESDPEKYFANIFKKAYTEGSVYLFGEHYLIPGIIYQLHPLVTLTVQMLTNLTDGSFYFAPQIEYNIAESIYIAGGAFAGIGKEPGVMTLKSEFGSYPDTYFTSFRIYF